jgi:hypothetical protein
MTVVTTIDVYDMTNREYRAVLDRMGVEERPEPGIYLHITAQTDFGYRIIEIWDHQEGFEEFAQRRMVPALEDLGIDRKSEITIKPLHNLFAPRLSELPGFLEGLPGAPGTGGRRTMPASTDVLHPWALECVASSGSPRRSSEAGRAERTRTNVTTSVARAVPECGRPTRKKALVKWWTSCTGLESRRRLLATSTSL